MTSGNTAGKPPPDELERMLGELQRAADLTVPYALRTAVTLGLAEELAAGPRKLPELAEAVGAQQAGVHKVVRVLANEGFFELQDDTVSLAARGWVLLEGIAHARLDHRRGYSRIDDGWPGLLHTVRTGKSGFEHVRGRSFWAELATDETLVASFDEQLAQWMARWAVASVEVLPITAGNVVDVGGGIGRLLAQILRARPETTGTLVDLPSTAARAEQLFAEHGLTERTTIAAQSFFEPLPSGGVLYLLAQVLHDWPDAESVAILRRVAEAAGDAPIVLIERLTGDVGDHVAIDLLMHVLFGAGERSEQEFAALATQAGLTLVSTRPILDGLSAIELRRHPER
ncbi:methyltransferase [Kribbella sp. CA-247076]|uniref:methyltransferase n=1 Tax=Kribbella sp. CA-247076 TaxID=3239941 RepID=UPI003D8F9FFB